MFSFLLAALGVAPAAFFYLHGRRDSNSQPMVLETTTLPIELHPYGGTTQIGSAKIPFYIYNTSAFQINYETHLVNFMFELDYSKISVT